MIDILKGRFWDKPWSLVDGCTPCSPGCDHCWSAAMAHRFQSQAKNDPKFINDGQLTTFTGKFNGLVETHPERLSIPMKRRKPTVFSIWNDLFHEAVPDDFIDDALKTMISRPDHTFLVLTKRPHRMTTFFAPLPGSRFAGHYQPTSNIYLGLTVCNQQEADEKIPVFLQVPGKKFLSIEPMLGEIDFKRECFCPVSSPVKIERHLIGCPADNKWGIDAVILGGETLGNRPGREMNIEWAESVADQCAAAGVPLFVKQLHIGGKVSKNITEWPEKLQRRELPWRK